LDYGSKALVSPGSYTQVVILNIYHSLATSGEPVTLNSTSPPGITVSFSPSSPVQLPASAALNVTVILTASQAATIGNGTVTIHGSSGANSQTASFSLKVVQYRVVMVHSTFIPSVLNVTAGSTVYWQNFDGPAGGCGGSAAGTGLHNVVFTTIQGANSSAISQFGVYTYTFNTPGTYFYYSSLDTDHVMNGTINVLSSGGGGAMTVNMPAFSYFKEGNSPAISPVAIAATAATAAKPAGEGAATSLLAVGAHGLADLVFPSTHSSAFSGLGFGAVVSVLLGLAALGAALAMSTTGKRNLTVVGAGIVGRLLRSDSSQ
jgi:plastocyanin